MQRRRNWARAASVLLVTILGGQAFAEDDEALSRAGFGGGRAAAAPDGWSFFRDRKNGAGLRLRVEVAGQPAQERLPVADTMAIQYIAKGTFGNHPRVSVDGGDRNRIFVRFDLDGIAAGAKVTLRLASLQGNKPLSKPLPLGLFPVKEAWREESVSWEAQPAHAEKPALTFALRTDDGWNEVDVTALIADAKRGHGWLLKAAQPVAPTIERRLPARGSGKSVADPEPLRRRARDARKTQRAAPDGYSWTRQREVGAGVRLRVERADGTTSERLPQADAMLIAYLADGAYGAHPTLALDGAARNRVLVRFDLDGLDDAERVTLRLAMLDGTKRLDKPMAVGIYAIEAAWDEYGTSWSTAPETAKDPVAAFDLPPGDAWVDVDVTKWIRTQPFPHGWLLRAARPVKPTVAPAVRNRGAAWRSDVLGLVPWAESPSKALQQAQDTERLVLTVLRASYNAVAENTAEDIFLACVLADPSVHGLIREHYVAFRAFQHGAAYTVGTPFPRDPLQPLGIASHEIKPLALVVTNRSGRVVDSLQGMGTFHPRIVRDFLTRNLTGAPTPLTRPDENAAHYKRGLASDISAEERSQHFAKIDAKSPWHLKVRAWQTWPERMAHYERLYAPEMLVFVRKRSTEVLRAYDEDIVPLAVSRLRALQRKNGGWGAATGYAASEAGISALAMLALARHVGNLEGPAVSRVDLALARAASWRDGVLEHADPHTLNAWGGCYLLDLLVDRLDAKDPKTKERAQRAVTLLQAGQLKHGAWSYDRRFGENWKGGFGGWPVTNEGRAHSMNTGPALVALAEAKAAGLRVSSEALSRGAEALLAMRDAPAVFTYTWPGKRNFNTLEQSIGRACGCEHALFLLGKNKPEDLELAIATFMANREHFWKIAKVTGGWSPPRAISSYFCLFAYYHAARAIKALGGKQAPKRLALLRQDVLAHVEIDGTWVDYPDVGKSYGTAMGLLLLDLTAPK